MDLSGCELIILTCCYSGHGTIRSDEGLHGLGRALLYAGARAAILSFWEVPDVEATVKLMEYFYDSYLECRKPAIALRNAQLAMINHGYSEEYWAPFYVFGKGV